MIINKCIMWPLSSQCLQYTCSWTENIVSSVEKERKKKQIKSQLSFQIHKYMVIWNVTLQRATAATLAAMGSNIEVKGICIHSARSHISAKWAHRCGDRARRHNRLQCTRFCACACVMCLSVQWNKCSRNDTKWKKSRGVVEINHKSQLQEIVAVRDIVKNFKIYNSQWKQQRTHQSLPLENRRHAEKAGGHKCQVFIYYLFVDATSNAHGGACYDCVRIVRCVTVSDVAKLKEPNISDL